VFQVHAVDAKGEIVVARKLTRSQLIRFFAELPCVVAMEACSSAHHWGQALIAHGHEVRLLPPAHVKPYVRRNKNDPVDAAAICEARSRPERTDSNSGQPRGSCPGQRAATCRSKWMVLVFHCS
jgi:transposase